MKNLPAFIAEISGAGGFRNYGDAAIAAAVAGAASLTNTLSKGGRGLGMAGQGLVGAGVGAYKGAGIGANTGGALANTPSALMNTFGKDGEAIKTGKFFKAANAILSKGGGAVGGVAGFATGSVTPASKSLYNTVKPHVMGKNTQP